MGSAWRKRRSYATRSTPPVSRKAEAKFTSNWGKAEEHTDCLSIGDEAAIEAMVDDFVTDMMGALEP